MPTTRAMVRRPLRVRAADAGPNIASAMSRQRRWSTEKRNYGEREWRKAWSRRVRRRRDREAEREEDGQLPIAGQTFEQFLGEQLQDPEFKAGYERKLAEGKRSA